MLIILSGRSGSGKTTIAREIARRLEAVYLRVDSIEQAIHSSALAPASIDDAGYRVAYALAADNLRLGRTVVADSVNPIALTRGAWRDVARACGVDAIDVEVVCSDPAEHRRRVETRLADIQGHRLPSWADVVARQYDAWDRDRIVIDTARAGVAESVDALRDAIRRRGHPVQGAAARLIVITGSMGSGKTAMMAEASDLLTDARIAHAAIDLDWLGVVQLAGSTDEIAWSNLASVWRNVAANGVNALLIATALETRADLDRLCAIVNAQRVVVCRLRAPLAVMRDRVRLREPGTLQAQLMDRAVTLEAILDSASLEDFTLLNDGHQPITEVAREMLVRAGWLAP